MKIIKTSSNIYTLRISQQDWTNIGKKAGWMKKAQKDGMNLRDRVKKLFCEKLNSTCKILDEEGFSIEYKLDNGNVEHGKVAVYKRGDTYVIENTLSQSIVEAESLLDAVKASINQTKARLN